MDAPRALSLHLPSTPTVLRRAGLVIWAVVVVDQATKGLVHHVAPPGAWGWLQPVHNPDLLMSVYAGTPAVLAAVAFAALAGFSLHLLHLARAGILPVWAMGLLAGGAASNLVDRVVHGAVRDWLALPFVVANLADFAVAAGAVGYLAAGARWIMTEWAAPSGGAPAAG